MVVITKIIEKRKARKVNKQAIGAFEGLSATIKDEINILETSIENMSKKYGVSEEQTPFILNHFLFFRVAFQDILRMTIQALSVEDEYDANLHSRNLVVHLHDFIDTTKDFLGKKMRDDLSLFVDSDYLKNELQSLKTIYKQIKDDIFQNLSDVRHNTVAHKDTNALKLSRMIKHVSADKIQRASIQVFMLFGFIINFHQTILYSLKVQHDSKFKVLEENLTEASGIEFKKPKSISAMLTKLLLIINGVEDEVADILCELTPDGIKKLKELKEYLEDDKNFKAT
jgi:hypothetical protein